MEGRSKLQQQVQHPNPSKQHQLWQQHYKVSMNKSSSLSSESLAHMDSSTKFHSPLHSEPGEPTDSTPYASPAAYLENPGAIVPVAHKFTQCSPPALPLQPLETRNFRAVDASATEQAKNPWSSAIIEEEGKSPAVTTILRRSKAKDLIKKANLWSRVLEALLCMSSFAVLAADRTQGWSGDSFDRYREYRFCLSVNVIAFAYSSFQAYNSAYHLITEKHVISHHFRCHFDFLMDQILSYLVLSAASAAATRVTDWETNWGKDEFTKMASASIALAFLGFVAFSFSSLLSAHSLWTRDFS